MQAGWKGRRISCRISFEISPVDFSIRKAAAFQHLGRSMALIRQVGRPPSPEKE